MHKIKTNIRSTKNRDYKTSEYMRIPIVIIAGLEVYLVWRLFFVESPFLLFLHIIALILIAVGFVMYIIKAYASIRKLEGGIVEGKNFETMDNNLSRAFNKIIVEKVKESMDREYAALICKKQAEINALQSQINPHFLYNTLDSIRGQALIDGATEIADMTEALAVFFRYSISHKSNLVSLAEELKNVDNYMIIQQFRFSNKFNVIKKNDADSEIMDCRMPKLTLQPIIENAIYHGLELLESEGTIVIRLTMTDQRLQIHITDNGNGIELPDLNRLNESLAEDIDFFSQSVQKKEGGIALKNVNDRIKLCFGNNYGITVYSTIGLGTDVEIVLPLVKDENYKSQFAINELNG